MFCIYKLTVGDEFYIGSTCNINKRFYDHNDRAHNDKYKDMKLYNAIRNNDYNMDIEILCWKQIDKKSSFNLEQEWIDKLSPTLNSRKSVLDIEETREKNKIRMRKVNRERTEEQKEKDRIRKKEWSEKNKNKEIKKVECKICNVFVRHEYEHIKTIKHKRNLENIEIFKK